MEPVPGWQAALYERWDHCGPSLSDFWGAGSCGKDFPLDPHCFGASFSERCSCERFPFINNNMPKTRLRGRDILRVVEDTHQLTHGLCLFSNV